MKLSPILFLQRIEDALPFWVERLGFKTAVQVPHGDALGFAILEKDGVEIMLQTRDSIAADVPELEQNALGSKSSLFIEVDDFDDICGRLEGLQRILEERVADYGMREVGVRAPGGQAVILGKPVTEAAH